MRKGFTIIEISITVAVLLILVIIIMGGISSFRESTNFNRARDLVLQTLKEARVHTIASFNATTTGVHFASTTITVFNGTVYNPNNTNNDARQLPALTEIANVNLSGGSLDVYFKRLTGEASNAGTITIRAIRNTGKSSQIQIYDSGLIETK